MKNKLIPKDSNLSSEEVLEKYPDIISDANWAKNPEKYLIDSNIRLGGEEAEKVNSFFKSYAQSEGLNRILRNQNKWWKSRHPYRKYVETSGVYTAKQRIKNAANRDVTIFELDSYPELSFYRPFNQRAYVGNMQRKEEIDMKTNFPYTHALSHEVGHHYDDTALLNGQREALDINKQYKENGHDEKYSERLADIYALKYLLYREGIYDSRGNLNVTPDQVKALRELYPNIRTFKQMQSDEDIAKMLNLIAMNSTNNTINIAKKGNKLIPKGQKGLITKLIKEAPKITKRIKQYKLENPSNYLKVQANRIGEPLDTYYSKLVKDTTYPSEYSTYNDVIRVNYDRSRADAYLKEASDDYVDNLTGAHEWIHRKNLLGQDPWTLKDQKANIPGMDFELKGRPENADGVTEDVVNDYFTQFNGTETNARMGQIFNWYGLRKGDKITGDMIEYAKQNYIPSTGFDNNMTEFFERIFDPNKLAKWANENSGKLFSIPTGILLYNINQNKINNEKNN